MNRIIQGDINLLTYEDIASVIEENSIDAIITSPPYAQQRKNQYNSISEEVYPEFTLSWIEKFKPFLKEGANIFINIRPHIRNGEISDYVLKTRLLLRESGLRECEELIWIKPDSPPLGSVNRPRRAWESILWFSYDRKNYCDPKAGGNESDRIGFENNKHEHGGKSHIHAGQNKASKGKARVRDYVEIGTGKVEKGFKHPAMFPRELPEYLINLGVPENGVVLDVFMGSGTTGRVCEHMNRKFIGVEIDNDFVDMSKNSFSLETKVYTFLKGVEDNEI